MRLSFEFCKTYSVRLDFAPTWTPETPRQVLNYFMGYNKSAGYPHHVGLDPEKQEFLSLSNPLKVVDDSEKKTVTVSLPLLREPGKWTNRLFPRFAVKMKNGLVVALTQAFQEDYIAFNTYDDRNYPERTFINSALDVCGIYEEPLK